MDDVVFVVVVVTAGELRENRSRTSSPVEGVSPNKSREEEEEEDDGDAVASSSSPGDSRWEETEIIESMKAQ